MVAFSVAAQSDSILTDERNEEDVVPTNLDVLRMLARRIALTSVSQTTIDDSSKVQLSVLPKESTWYISHTIGEGLQSKGLLITEDTSSPVEVSFGLKSGSVTYSNPRRNGFLGAKIVDRFVQLQLTAKIVNRLSGTILLHTDVEDSVADTIELSLIEQLENPTIAITKGALPREGFFSNVAEPLILLGSIAVAVLLLFNVRS